MRKMDNIHEQPFLQRGYMDDMSVKRCSFNNTNHEENAN
jgi:hypothetical protein